jgi:predicted branched-subunit amino acid permease
MQNFAPPQDEEDAGPSGSLFSWYLKGVRAAFSIPAIILASSFIGFAALTIDAGLALGHTLFMTGIVWALPAKVVMVGAINAGSGVLTTAFAVALSSVRLTPMVVAIVPELKARRTRTVTLYILSHFVAVTSWVLAMEKLPSIPRQMRTSWYCGLGSTLILLNMAVVAIVYMVAEGLPAPVSAALLLLTPLYFLTSMWGSARERAGKVAMVAGLFLGPVFHMVTPEFSLLATGLTGGAIAYGYHRIVKRRKVAP